MKFLNKNTFVSLFIYSLTATNSFSAIESNIIVAYSSGTSVLVPAGPADKVSYGTTFASTGSRVLSLCNSRQVTYDLAKIEYVPVAHWTGNIHQSGSQTLYLFDSGAPGMDLILRGGSYYFDVELNPGQNFASLPPESKIAWVGHSPNATRMSSGFQAFAGAQLYRSGERLAGSVALPQQMMYKYNCYDTNNVLQEVNNISLAATNIISTVTGCTPDSKAATINMEGIPVATVEKANTTTLLNTQQYLFSLKCDPNIELMVSFVDLNDPTNSSNISTLTSDSTAAGIGYAVTSITGTRFQFGPDGSSVGVPGQRKYYIGRAGSADTNPMSLRLNFSYVKKEDEPIKTGTAKSIIGITYSYQ